MQSRKLRILPAACCLLLAAALVVPVTEASAADKKDLKTALQEAVDEEIVKVYYDDFDANGEYEAFIVTVSWDDSTQKSLYFVNSDQKVTQLASELEEDITFRTVRLKSATLLSVNEEVTYTTQQTLYSVSDTKAKKAFTGYDITVTSGNKFTSDANVYDAVKNVKTGKLFAHSEKPYYFYYDKSAGKIRQYTAKKISRAKFLKKYKNAKTKLKKLEKKYGTVKSIYVRENGKVHVNFKKTKNGYTYFTNVTFTVKGKTLKNAKVNTGTYKKKLNTSSSAVKSQSTTSYKRSVIVRQAKKFLGYKESNGTHKTIIDLYNANRPWAVNYQVTYKDAWCATFVSAVAITTGYTDIIPTECSCRRMIELLKEMDCWEESDSYRPKKGDLIFYDWQDSGKGDNTGTPDHIGIVTAVNGNTITVIEGNYKNSVRYRKIKVNGRYIRGYGVPAYNQA